MMNTKKFMVALVSATIMMAGMQSCGDSQKMKELEKENQELQENLDKTMADYNAYKKAITTTRMLRNTRYVFLHPKILLHPMSYSVFW